jgi:hypothetical protein
MIKLPPDSYSVYSSKDPCGYILHALHETSLNVALFEQDTNVVKFLRGRKNLIELKPEVTKASLDISKLKTNDEKVILILCLIVIKKINSLLIELGPLAVKTFLLDLLADLVKKEVCGSVLENRLRLQAVDIIRSYCRQHLEGHIIKDSFSINPQRD